MGQHQHNRGAPMSAFAPNAEDLFGFEVVAKAEDNDSATHTMKVHTH